MAISMANVKIEAQGTVTQPEDEQPEGQEDGK